MKNKKNTVRKTVFISSTFVDLKEERRKIWDALEQFDVVVKGMEQFGARKTTPLETCISEVEQSDIYVGVFGMRFGTEEPMSAKSYSQLEYEKAVEQNKDILIYLIDEDNSNVTPSLIQYDQIQKLNSFKDILKAKHTIDTFSDPQDLVTKLQRRFNELLTPKNIADIKDDYENTKNIIDLFTLTPAAYSGREVKLRVKFWGEPKPASKAICQNFNFEFGKTVVCKIDVVQPTFKLKNFRHIFIEFEQFKKFISLDKADEHEIFAKVLFKSEKVKNITTDFKDKLERVYEPQSKYYSLLNNFNPYETSMILPTPMIMKM